MLPYRDSRFTRVILIGFFLLVAGYAYFEGRGLIRGPSIEISGRVMEVSEPFITLEGRAERITSLSMNGTEIAVTEEGAFSESYVLAPGYNRIVLEARDRYGKTTERAIEIVYTASTSSPQAASTTPAQ
jgi:hypothetical protein